MVDAIRIHYEGDKSLREGWAGFFREVVDSARSERTALRFVSGGSKSTTIRDFVVAIRQRKGDLALLLVDADVGGSTADLIRQTKADAGWDASIRADDGQLHYMVQIMESWFLADASALSGYYGRGFRERSLVGDPTVEQIPKSDVESRLKAATRGTSKGQYHKTRHAPSLLRRIDPDAVRRAAPHCDRLFKVLEDALR